MTILKLSKEDIMADLLEESLKNQDLTIFCLNGRFFCNTFLFSTVFPGIGQILDTFMCLEECIGLTFPDISVKEFTDFFNNIYQRESDLNPSSGIQYLLNFFQQANFDVPKRVDVDLVKNEIDYSFDEGFDKGVDEEDYEEKPVTLKFSKKKQTTNKRSKKSSDSDSDWNEDDRDDSDLDEFDKNEVKDKVFVKEKRKYRSMKTKVLSSAYAYKLLSSIEKRKLDEGAGSISKSAALTRTNHLKFAFKSLRCSVCEVKFKLKEELFRHVFEIHGPHPLENVTCYDCNVVLDSPGKLRGHINRGHPPLILPCPECGLEFATKELRAHMKEHSMISCEVCGEKFTSKLRLKKHTISFHDGKDYSKMRDGELSRECDRLCKCNIKFENVKEKLNHFKLVHLNYKACPICGKAVGQRGGHICLEEEEERKRKKAEETHVCQLCGKVYSSMASLDYHNRTIHSKNEATCQFCGKVFDHEIALKSHIHRSHREITPCDLCGAMVKHMKTHLQTVHLDDSEKNHQCSECGKGFDNKDSLKRHMMNAHLKLRPHKCRYGCDMAYNDRSNMRQHERKKHGAVWTEQLKQIPTQEC